MWIGSKLVATNRVVFAVIVAGNVCQRLWTLWQTHRNSGDSDC